MESWTRGAMKSWYNKLFFLLSIFPFSFSEVLTYGMDDTNYCSTTSRRLVLIEEGTGVIIIGKSTPPESSVAAASCTLIFGPKSQTKTYLYVKFESFYINDCGITLKLKQSPSSVFDQDVEHLGSLSCNMPTPPPFYTSGNRFLMLHLGREDIYMRDYNFRINITVSEGPPRSGPSTAVIILIAVGLLSAIIVISILLIKHIKLKRVVWRERRAERAIERAIQVYNSQELHRDVPYTTVPSQRHCPAQDRLQYGSNISSYGPNSNLLIVQPGRNSRSNSDINCSDSSEINRHSMNSSHENRLNESNREFDTESLPPSYEEALEMPKPSLNDSPLYANM